jgi:hypothetical protein
MKHTSWWMSLSLIPLLSACTSGVMVDNRSAHPSVDHRLDCGASQEVIGKTERGLADLGEPLYMLGRELAPETAEVVLEVREGACTENRKNAVWLVG